VRNISDEVIEKMKTHILCSVIFFPKIMPFMKYGRTRQAMYV